MSSGVGYQITYNDFGSQGASNFAWQYIKVQEYSSTPIFADDDQTHWTTHNVISGTAFLTGTVGDILTVLDNARINLSKQGRRLLITLDGATVADVGNDDFDKTDGLASTSDTFDGKSDQASYPRSRFTINQFHGSENVVVSFTFEWMETKIDTVIGEDAIANWAVLSHQWHQRFSIAESGLQSWAVEGSLRVRPWNAPVDAPNVGEVQHGRNPDSYRAIVMPVVPSNFRIKKMDWATDKTGEVLVYTVEMQEHARGLPAPARVGSGSFVFKKSIDSTAGLLGTKMFDAELEGDASADPRELLAALLDSSTTRINWTGANKDLITSIEVREQDIFSKKKIGLRVTARGIDPNVVKSLSGGLGDSGTIPSNFGIMLDFIRKGAEQTTVPSVYGGALISSFKRQLFISTADYNRSDFPKAQLMKMPNSPTEIGGSETQNTDAPTGIAETIYTLNDNVLPETVPTAGDLTGEEINGQSDADHQASYVKVSGTERLMVRPRIEVFSPHGDGERDIPWQVSNPEIWMESEYRFTRNGQPPPMLHFAIPPNTIVKKETSSTDMGELDSRGVRMYTRLYERTARVLFGWDEFDTGEFVISFGIGGTSVTMRFFRPIIANTHRPFDPRVDEQGNIGTNDIFTGSSGDSTQFYETDFTVPVSSIG